MPVWPACSESSRWPDWSPRGLSNRVIAERLHLSERTAESHVKNICDKLGFNSTSQVAAWVAAGQPAP